MQAGFKCGLLIYHPNAEPPQPQEWDIGHCEFDGQFYDDDDGDNDDDDDDG
jgi:hypothetical protein